MTQIKVIVPQWFDDGVRLGAGSLPTAEYEWPDPQVLRQSAEGSAGTTGNSQSTGNKKTAVRTPGQDVLSVQAGQRDIWQKRRILLSPSLELPPGRREAVEAGIERANGVVVRYADDGNRTEEEAAQKIQDVDVFVTRYRSGPAYVKVRTS